MLSCKQNSLSARNPFLATREFLLTLVVFDTGTLVVFDTGTLVVFDTGTLVVFDTGTLVVFDTGTLVVFDTGTSFLPIESYESSNITASIVNIYMRIILYLNYIFSM